MLRYISPAATSLLLTLFLSASLRGQVSITLANTPLVQNFDALPATGTGTATGGIFQEGWSFLESGSNADLLFRAGSGTSSTGDTYSFGTNGINPDTDRAFGLLQSTNLTSVIGFRFTNHTGQTIASVVVGYTGETWRLNTGGDGLSFAFQVGDVALQAPAGWTAVNALDFSTPVTGSTAVDGNSNANRMVIAPVTIHGLYIPDGATVTFRWTDPTSGSSAGMAIDDFTITLVPAATGYFRTKASGNWNSVTTWEYSLDGINWQPATTVPTDRAAGVTILAGHTVTVSADLTISRLTVGPGGKLLYAGGTLTLTDGPGDDLVLQGTNSIFETAAAANPVLATNAIVRIGTASVLLLSGNNHLLDFHTAAFVYADGAVMEYSFAGLPAVTGTFFTGQDPGAVPVFRYSSAYTGNTGGNGATTINGKVEVTAGKTFNLGGVNGTLVIRNGITGAGTLQAATTVLLTGSTAECSGAGTINASLSVENGCTTTVLNNKSFSKNNVITVNGTLDLGTAQLLCVNGTATVQVNGTGKLQTANADGLLGAAGSLKSGQFSVSFAAGSMVDYKANSPQLVTTTGLPAYQHLLISGTGLKTAQPGANLVVQGSCIVRNGATLALSGSATENLYLNNNASLQVEAGGTFDTGGESSLTSSAGTPTVKISGRLITRDAQGLTGLNSSMPSITPVLDPACNVEYGRQGDQVVQATLMYENMVFSGSGTKTPASALSLNGSLTLSGSVVLDGSNHTIGGANNNLVMTGTARLIVGGTGTRPSLTGTYTLAPTTTIEFSASNTSPCSIRQGAILYANIVVSGNNITAPGSGITLQEGGSFTVKNGGVFKIASPNGLLASTNAAILSVNNPSLTLEPGSTIDYNGAAQVLTTGIAYSNITLSNSGIKTAAEPFTVGQNLTRSGSASLGGAGPVYAPGATLAYADAAAGRTYTVGPEWPATNLPTNLTVSLSGTGTCSVQLNSDLTVPGVLNLAAGNLDLGGKSLTVAGGITGTGTLYGSAAAGLTITGGISTLRFNQAANGLSNALKFLKLEVGSVTLGNAANLYDLLDVAGGTLDLNGQSLTLKSDATKTARVAERKGTLLGATNVTVERYINGASGRRWRLLSAPVSGSSINTAWQEGRTWNGSGSDPLSPGYGTLITGQQQGTATAANSKGFDFWNAIAGAQASVRSYQGASDWTKASWLPLSSTLTPGAFDGQQAYLLFVRGDRSVTTGAGTTVLRPRGTLKEPASYTVTLTANQSHTLLGNPYASPLNFYRLWQDNSNSIEPWFWVWQASLGTATGGYVLLKPVSPGSPLYEAVPDGGTGGTPANPIISSGEGFFVVPKNAATGGSFTIRQSHKDAGSPALSVFRQADTGPAKIFVNLSVPGQTGDTLLDGALAEYGGTETIHIRKAAQSGETIAVYAAGSDWVVAGGGFPAAGDTLRVRLWNMAEKAYRLTVRVAGLPGLSAVLIDNYLQRETVLDPAGRSAGYDFTITSDSGSHEPLRFFVVFRQPQVLPLVVTRFAAAEKNGGVELFWDVADESAVVSYALEKSSDGASFQVLTTFNARKGSGEQRYQSFDGQPAPVNYYRLRLVGMQGDVRYSQVIQVRLKNRGEGFAVFPNPARGSGTLVRLTDLPKGSYRLRLLNPAGQVLQERDIEHSGGTAGYPLTTGQLPNGVYGLELEAPSGGKKRFTLAVIH